MAISDIHYWHFWWWCEKNIDTPAYSLVKWRIKSRSVGFYFIGAPEKKNYQTNIEWESKQNNNAKTIGKGQDNNRQWQLSWPEKLGITSNQNGHFQCGERKTIKDNTQTPNREQTLLDQNVPKWAEEYSIPAFVSSAGSECQGPMFKKKFSSFK